MHYFYPGQLIVSGSSGKVFRVKKVNPKNLVSVDETGKSWNVRREFASPAPEGTEFNAPLEPIEVPINRTSLVLGSTVRFKGSGAQRFPGTYVLIAHPQRGGERARFAKLGGDGDQFVRAPFTSVEEVEV